MKVFVLLGIVLLVVTLSVNAKSIKNNHQKWEHFKKTYKKTYASPESEQQHKEIFEKNSILIDKHNANAQKSETFTLKMNQFGDLSNQEYIKLMTDTPFPLLTNPSDHSSQYIITPYKTKRSVNEMEVLSMIDLRINGSVSAVKDQGMFGKSSWAYSVIGALEGQIFRKQCPNEQILKGKCSEKLPIQPLSEKFLIQCVSMDEDDIQTGNSLKKALYFIKNRGIYTEKLYSEVEKLNLSCLTDQIPVSIHIDSLAYRLIKTDTYFRIKRELLSRNPVPAYLDASSQSFQFYHQGIYKEPKNNPTEFNLNHAVLIVGYEEINGTGYWLVKNSWGKSWGDEGYMKIAFETCGIGKRALQLYVHCSQRDLE